jgi:hypothetical protein
MDYYINQLSLHLSVMIIIFAIGAWFLRIPLLKVYNEFSKASILYWRFHV